jgi:DNA-directed RNA polymerase subunit RPC12/RpoP
MTKYTHYSYFPNERKLRKYLVPNLCFVCRKCFKKPAIADASICPNCGGRMLAVNRKFSAPASHDISQWKKVQFLVEHGFLFHSVYETVNENGQYKKTVKVSYPATIDEARDFVIKYKAQAATKIQTEE